MIEKINDGKIVYVIGAGHSGSTLFDVLLSMHPHITGTGEVHRLSLKPNERRCGCGSTISHCEFWASIIESYLGAAGCSSSSDWTKFAPVTLGRKGTIGPKLLELAALSGSRCLTSTITRLFSWPKDYDQVISNSIDLYETISKQCQTPVVVDSTKNPLRGKMLYLKKPRRVLFVHVVRDGRAVAASMMKRENAGMDKAARSWKQTLDKVEATLLSVPNEKKITIRYEDLCLRPDAEISRVWRWIGLDDLEAGCLGNLAVASKHQIPGNPVLYKGIDHVKIDEKWREALSPDDLACFSQIAGKKNSRYGYE